MRAWLFSGEYDLPPGECPAKSILDIPLLQHLKFWGHLQYLLHQFICIVLEEPALRIYSSLYSLLH